jgi:hypothetical protein
MQQYAARIGQQVRGDPLAVPGRGAPDRAHGEVVAGVGGPDDDTEGLAFRVR